MEEQKNIVSAKKKEPKQKPVEQPEVVVEPAAKPKKKEQAVVVPLYPSAGFRSPYFEVLVGKERIFVGSRIEACMKAEEYNRLTV